MFQSVKYNAVANRFTPFSDFVDIQTVDWAGAAAKLQVRTRKNGGAVAAEAAVSAFLLPGVEPETTRFEIEITESVMEAMPRAPEPDADVILFWDLHITPPGEEKFVAFYGTFTVRAGVTE